MNYVVRPPEFECPVCGLTLDFRYANNLVYYKGLAPESFSKTHAIHKNERHVVVYCYECCEDRNDVFTIEELRILSRIISINKLRAKIDPTKSLYKLAYKMGDEYNSKGNISSDVISELEYILHNRELINIIENSKI